MSALCSPLFFFLIVDTLHLDVSVIFVKLQSYYPNDSMFLTVLVQTALPFCPQRPIGIRSAQSGPHIPQPICPPLCLPPRLEAR